MVILLIAVSAAGQQSVRGTVTLVAHLPGTVNVEQSAIPFMLDVRGGQCSTSVVPLRIRWNLNPKEARGFRVIAKMELGPSGSPARKGGSTPPDGLQARVGTQEFRTFKSAGQLVLLARRITLGNRIGNESDWIELKVDAELAQLSDGTYNGMLYLRAESL